MGEAKRRGTREQRCAEAIKRKKRDLVKALGDGDEHDEELLRSGITPFIERMGYGEWGKRRASIIEYLTDVIKGRDLERAKAIRVQQDEIGWYIFLAEKAIEDPFCMDVSQAARNLPFIAGLGERWKYHSKVSGIENKIDDLLKKYKSEPDGLLFEILVALSYAAKGWDVEFIDTNPPYKSADLRVRKGNREFVVECKRQSRIATYSEMERNEFLRRWDIARNVLIKKQQWLWFKCDVHIEITEIPDDFLLKIFSSSLPIRSDQEVIYDGPEATVLAKVIDKEAVQKHLSNYSVKQNSPMLSRLLGGDWVPENSDNSMSMLGKISQVIDCEPAVLSGYVEEISWACGMTRKFDAEISIEKKARDVKKLLSDAVKQVPDEIPSIVHIAVETLEGNDVENRRTEKVMSSIPSFITDKPVAAVRLHRFQPNMVIDKYWEFDETVERFQRDGIDLSNKWGR